MKLLGIICPPIKSLRGAQSDWGIGLSLLFNINQKHKVMAQPNRVEEYKDNSGDNRIHVWSQGNLTIGSLEGYENKSDMRESAINGAIMILEHYDQESEITPEQMKRISTICWGM